MLGKTVPEPNSDGRVFVCSAGISRELRSLIRIYPLARRAAPKRWSVSRIRLCRNPQDNRLESWKLAGDRSPTAHERINETFEQVGDLHQMERPDLLERHVVGSIQEANDRRLSLAILHPKIAPVLRFDYNPESPESPQLCLFDEQPKPQAGARRFAYIPRLLFADETGDHSLTLRDWGCFEFLRKYGYERRHELADALHLDQDCSLFIGNLNHHRTSWIVISVLRGLRVQPALPLLESLV